MSEPSLVRTILTIGHMALRLRELEDEIAILKAERSTLVLKVQSGTAQIGVMAEAIATLRDAHPRHRMGMIRLGRLP